MRFPSARLTEPRDRTARRNLSRIIRPVLAVMAAVLFLGGPAMAQDEQTVFGDWTIRCDEVPDGAVQCALTQAVEAEDRENVWLNAYAFKPADREGATLLSVLVPLRVILTRGLGIRIDEQELTVFDFITCSTEGCLASIELSDALMTALREGTEALFIFYFEDAAGIGVPVSLNGFGAGIDALP